jgi:hypothetical protein
MNTVVGVGRELWDLQRPDQIPIAKHEHKMSTVNDPPQVSGNFPALSLFCSCLFSLGFAAHHSLKPQYQEGIR